MIFRVDPYSRPWMFSLLCGRQLAFKRPRTGPILFCIRLHWCFPSAIYLLGFPSLSWTRS